MPPFKWGDRYDLVGLAVGAGVLAALLLVGVSVWLTIVFAAVAMNLTSYLLRGQAGVPQATLWQRMRTRRHGPR